MNEQQQDDHNFTRREFIELAVATGFVAGLPGRALADESRQGIPYRILGRTGEKVSAIGLGATTLEASPMKKKAFELFERPSMKA